MARLAIWGHATRGNEVIAWLEALGGRNLQAAQGTEVSQIYYIRESNKEIVCTTGSVTYIPFYVVSLEEFEDLCVFKIGDSVYANGYFGPREVCEIMWDDKSNQIKYGIGVGEWFDRDKLVSGTYKFTVEVDDETLHKLAPEPKTIASVGIPQIHFGDTYTKIELVLGNSFDIIKEDDKWFVVRKSADYQLKDGDVVVVNSEQGYKPFIYKQSNNEHYHCCYCGIHQSTDTICIDGSSGWSSKRHSLRLATDNEKTKFFDTLARNGYRWNATTKTLENINKFSVTSLKAFDKVLVKMNDHWCADWFSHIIDSKNICCVGGIARKVIPYNDETKHLLGTCGDYPD